MDTILHKGQEQENKAFNDIKDALLSMNGALLRCGVNKDDVIINIARLDWVYMKEVLSYETSNYHKFFKLTNDEDVFILAGIKVRAF